MGNPDLKIFVISLGGSVFASSDKEGTPDIIFLKQFSTLIEGLRKQGFKFAIVTGGGKLARKRIAEEEAKCANNFYKDLAGIEATRENARYLIKTLPSSHKEVITKPEEAKQILETGKIPISGGMIPGFTTDAVSAIIAESLNATFINLSNVEGVYNKDPRKDREAKLIESLSHKELLKKVSTASTTPGQNLIIDLPCAAILRRSKIPAFIMLGTDLENLKNAILTRSFKGTLIES